MDLGVAGDDPGVLDAYIPARKVGDHPTGFADQQTFRCDVP